MNYLSLTVAAVVLFVATEAGAIDAETCPTDIVCASKPQSIVDTLQEAGYRATLKKDSAGEYISSAASGYNFTINLLGCKDGAQCKYLQFAIQFTANNAYNAEYANGYHLRYRSLQMAVLDNKQLRLTYEVTTVGGLPKQNFIDVVDLWATGLNGFGTYSAEQAKKAAPPAAPTPPK